MALQGLLRLHMPFGISCSDSEKNVIGIVIAISLNLYIALGEKDILTLLVLPNHEHVIAFYILVFSPISFFNVL